MKKGFSIIFSLFLILQSIQGFVFEDGEFTELESEEGLIKLYARWRSHYSVVRLPEEIEARLNVFKKSMMYVYNTMAEPYNQKLNKFADWTLEEFSEFYVDCNDNIVEHESRSREVRCENANPPLDSFDWRKENAVTSVKNQSKCCKCLSFQNKKKMF